MKENNRPEFVQCIFDYARCSVQLGQQQLAETLLDTCVHVGGGPKREKFATSFAKIADDIMNNLANPGEVNFAGRLMQVLF